MGDFRISKVELDEATMQRLYGTVTVKQNVPGR
mgnify:CR=1 FL=1